MKSAATATAAEPQPQSSRQQNQTKEAHRTPSSPKPTLPPQLSQYAPQAAQLAAQAGYVAKKAALWLGLWILAGITGFILLILALTGHSYAGPLLLLLMVGCGTLMWQQLSHLRRSAPVSGLNKQRGNEESHLDERTRKLIADLQRLTHSSKVGPLQHKLSYTTNLITEALKATATQGGLITRETHDIRMAAERDLPEALRAFEAANQAGASVRYAEVLLAEQLQALQDRMLEILHQYSHERLRDLEEHRLFVAENYKNAQQR